MSLTLKRPPPVKVPLPRPTVSEYERGNSLPLLASTLQFLPIQTSPKEEKEEKKEKEKPKKRSVMMV
ncbi:unnamed protein product [Didymodactylos carnosus]|uniref:Uncharacterized protein n=1 Tax=Didymodactylos carnosus TaxID=1234261 RepID=A0A815RIN0_9BILA|nr:unnamed protein product [Didymodactylos carnosus]CAF4343677.1 unnamed protein product [Didymodactylos carnosus]